ncbi:MAG: hypothetical protein R2690_05940 [Acidimicrobiales bacterium]
MTSVDAGSGASSRHERLDAVIATVTGDLDAAHAAREAGLPACRRAIRAAGSSIRATHRLEFDRAELLLAESEHEIRAAQAALAPFPALVHAGFLADAEKEFVEARLVLAFVRDEELPGPDELAVGAVAWMKGLAEAASELRRHLLDRLRGGDLARGEELLGVMDDAYDALVRRLPGRHHGRAPAHARRLARRPRAHPATSRRRSCRRGSSGRSTPPRPDLGRDRGGLDRARPARPVVMPVLGLRSIRAA